jgi:hypothetical protein
MLADAKHDDDASFTPAALTRTAGAKNTKRARGGANVNVIATIVMFSLNLFCELIGQTNTENPKVGNWTTRGAGGSVDQGASKKLQIWLNAKVAMST